MNNDNILALENIDDEKLKQRFLGQLSDLETISRKIFDILTQETSMTPDEALKFYEARILFRMRRLNLFQLFSVPSATYFAKSIGVEDDSKSMDTFINELTQLQEKIFAGRLDIAEVFKLPIRNNYSKTAGAYRHRLAQQDNIINSHLATIKSILADFGVLAADDAVITNEGFHGIADDLTEKIAAMDRNRIVPLRSEIQRLIDDKILYLKKKLGTYGDRGYSFLCLLKNIIKTHPDYEDIHSAGIQKIIFPVSFAPITESDVIIHSQPKVLKDKIDTSDTAKNHNDLVGPTLLPQHTRDENDKKEDAKSIHARYRDDIKAMLGIDDPNFVPDKHSEIYKNVDFSRFTDEKFSEMLQQLYSIKQDVLPTRRISRSIYSFVLMMISDIPDQMRKNYAQKERENNMKNLSKIADTISVHCQEFTQRIQQQMNVIGMIDPEELFLDFKKDEHRYSLFSVFRDNMHKKYHKYVVKPFKAFEDDSSILSSDYSYLLKALEDIDSLYKDMDEERFFRSYQKQFLLGDIDSMLSNVKSYVHKTPSSR